MVVIKTKKNTSNGINKPYLFLATGGIFVDDVLSSERLIDILECDKNKLKKYINKCNGQIIDHNGEPVIAFFKNKHCRKFIDNFNDEFEKELVLKKIDSNEDIVCLFRKSERITLDDATLKKTLTIAISISLSLFALVFAVVLVTGGTR